MAKRFEKMLDAATEQTLVEPNWEGILECVDMIRGSDVPVKDAIGLIQKRYHSSNPHVAHHALLVLEACVKNCGKKFHTEVATKEFMDDLKNLIIASAPDNVKEKVLELIQCWSSAFRSKPEYKIVMDTHNLLKMNGFEFPTMKEADAMFIADSAPDWAEGDNCYRCRTEFGVFTRKHHCRACGQIFCLKCSSKQMFLPQFGIEKSVRVCEQCFEKRVNQKTTAPTNQAQPSATSSAADEAKEKARLQELMDKEAEELQLALAISQSEAEAKEQERQQNLYRSYNGNKANGYGSAGLTMSTEIPINSQPEVYKGAGGSVMLEEMSSTKMENDNEPPLDPMLAKYLDRDYWDRKRTDREMGPERATAPPPSEGGGSSGASQFAANNTDSYANQNGFDSASLAPTPSVNSVATAFDKLTLCKQQSMSMEEDDSVADTSQFCKVLKEQVDTMDNRMRSNLLRGRSIVNDSAIHSLFAQLTGHHADVLSRLNKLESDREYYERLQDHLAHIQEARQAVNALREEFEVERQEQQKEEQQRRRVQMQQKLGFMRQKKHEMLLYQRHMALQRFQEEEQRIQQNRFAPQPYNGGYSAYNNSPVSQLGHPQPQTYHQQGVQQEPVVQQQAIHHQQPAYAGQHQGMPQKYAPAPPQQQHQQSYPGQPLHQPMFPPPQHPQAFPQQQSLPSHAYMMGNQPSFQQQSSQVQQPQQPFHPAQPIQQQQQHPPQQYQPSYQPQDYSPHTSYQPHGYNQQQTFPVNQQPHQNFVPNQQPPVPQPPQQQPQVDEDLLISFD